jgi:hypothetical protein
MHRTIAGAADIVKIYSGTFWFLPAGRENIIQLYSRQGNGTDGLSIVFREPGRTTRISWPVKSHFATKALRHKVWP